MLANILGFAASNTLANPKLRVLILPDRENKRASANKGFSTEKSDRVPHWTERKIQIFGIKPSTLPESIRKVGFYNGMDPWRAIRAAILQRRYDLVLCYFESPAFLLCLMKKLGLFKPRIVVNEVNFQTGWRLRDYVANFVVQNADGISVISEHLRTTITQQLPKANTNVHCSGFHVNEHFFDSSKARRSNRATTPYVFAVGDDRSRDYKTLVAAARLTSVNFVVKAKQDLEEFGDNFRQLKNQISREELRDLYDGALCVVIPLLYTATPGGITSLAEAFSMQKCVIIARTPSLEEFTQQHTIKYTPSDPTSLAEAIDFVAANPEITAHHGQAAKRFQSETMSKQLYFDRLAQFLVQTAAPKKP